MSHPGSFFPVSYLWTLRVLQSSNSAASSCVSPAFIRACCRRFSGYLPPSRLCNLFFFLFHGCFPPFMIVETCPNSNCKGAARNFPRQNLSGMEKSRNLAFYIDSVLFRRQQQKRTRYFSRSFEIIISYLYAHLVVHGILPEHIPALPSLARKAPDWGRFAPYARWRSGVPPTR